MIALVAWRWKPARGKYVWIVTIIAEAALMLQVLVGTILVASKDYVAPRFHMFYGFVAFLTVGIAYQYRRQMRGRREMFYGLVGLFLMGLGIRAVLRRADVATAGAQRVLLLFGGRSAEHDVSRVTAVAVARALDRERYEVVPVAITTDGRWLLADSAQRAIDGGPGRAAERVPGRRRASRPRSGALDVDVVFPLLHGPYGEDGTVQGLLELADLPVRRSGVVGSAVAMDKVMMKRALRRRRAAVRADGRVPRRPRPRRARGAGRGRARLPVLREAGQPRLVGRACRRPPTAPSSTPPCDLALSYDEWIVVEEAITGREIELAVLGDDPPDGVGAGRDRARRRLLLLRRQVRGRRRRSCSCPRRSPTTQVAAAQALACRAFEACRCEAMARVDLFLTRTSTAAFLVNEVNTIPGFTPISMYPRLWEATRRAVPRAARPPHRPGDRPPRPPRPAGRPPARDAPRASSEVDDGAGEGAGDAVDLLDRRHDELAEVVERARLGLHDHVVGPGDVVGGRRRRRCHVPPWRPSPPARPRSGSARTR